jgi:hypothetical protein
MKKDQNRDQQKYFSYIMYPWIKLHNLNKLHSLIKSYP